MSSAGMAGRPAGLAIKAATLLGARPQMKSFRSDAPHTSQINAR